MEPQLVDGLRRRRTETKARWIALLHIEPVTTPLANPATLAFMIDDSLDAVLAALGDPRPARHGRQASPNRGQSHGSDSSNPFNAYFLAGKQALLEALVLAETEASGCNHEQREAAVAELTGIIEWVIGGEVNAFGQVCQNNVATTARVRAGSNGNEFAG